MDGNGNGSVSYYGSEVLAGSREHVIKVYLIG